MCVLLGLSLQHFVLTTQEGLCKVWLVGVTQFSRGRDIAEKVARHKRTKIVTRSQTIPTMVIPTLEEEEEVSFVDEAPWG